MSNAVEIIISAVDKASKEIDKVNSSLGKTGGAGDKAGLSLGKLTGIVGKVAPWATMGSAVLSTAQYLGDASKAAAMNAEVMAKQESILKATGYAAGLNAEQLANMAGEMERLTHIDGDLISQSQSLMLTFRNIGGETFPRAMQAAVDLQTTFGSLEASSMQLGKALNDPVAGISALARSGVTFSDVQKEQIKNFVATNQLAKAQAIILAEVENQIGGTAAAIADAGDGSQNLTNATGALSEAIGKRVLPATRAWNDALAETAWRVTDVLDGIAELDDWKQRVAESTGRSAEELDKFAQSSRGAARSVQRQVEEFIRAEQYGLAWKAALEAQGMVFEANTTNIKENTDALADNEQALKELSESNQKYLDLVGSMADAEASYTEKQEGFAQKRAELETELATLRRQGYWEQGEQIQGTLGKLEELTAAEQKAAEEFELAGRRRILSMLEQQLATDGLSTVEMDYLLNLGNQWGIYSDSAVAAAQAAMAEIDKLSNAIITLPNGKQIVIDLSVGTTYAGAGYSGSGDFTGADFASGTGGQWVTIPPGYPNDSFRANLSSGEQIMVKTPGEAAQSGGRSGPVELSPGSIAALADALTFRMQAAGIGQ